MRPEAERRAPAAAPARCSGLLPPSAAGSPGSSPARGPLWSQPPASSAPPSPAPEQRAPQPFLAPAAPERRPPSWGLASGPQSRGGVPRDAAARSIRLQAPGPATGAPRGLLGALQPLSSEACMVGREGLSARCPDNGPTPPLGRAGPCITLRRYHLCFRSAPPSPPTSPQPPNPL